ncbi:MAG: class I SAM-dependent methyltransferase [Thermoanaerobaculia bacterium]
MSRDAVKRVASRFRSRFLRYYVISKLATDPLYAAVTERLRGGALPVTDIGCGVGLTAFYLREHGIRVPIVGVDHDDAKIHTAREIAVGYDDLSFVAGDALDAAIAEGSVLLLDVLHYLSDDEQNRLLRTVAERVPRESVVIIREGIRDGSWRYRLTYAAELFARSVRWLKAGELNFPTRESIVGPFRERGFEVEVSPLWGRTPFNNYLFMFRRPMSGTTKR